MAGCRPGWSRRAEAGQIHKSLAPCHDRREAIHMAAWSLAKKISEFSENSEICTPYGDRTGKTSGSRSSCSRSRVINSVPNRKATAA